MIFGSSMPKYPKMDKYVWQVADSHWLIPLHLSDILYAVGLRSRLKRKKKRELTNVRFRSHETLASAAAVQGVDLAVDGLAPAIVQDEEGSETSTRRRRAAL